MLTRRARLIRERAVWGYCENTVADGALGNSVEVELDVLVEEC